MAGKDKDGHGYVLADISGRYPPAEWARPAITAYATHGADRIVAPLSCSPHCVVLFKENGFAVCEAASDMTQRRKIEVFTAGCPCCAEAVQLVEFLAGTEHDVEIRDMHDPTVAAAASGYGIGSVPAIVIDDRLSDCTGRGPDETTLAQEIFGGHGRFRRSRTRSNRRPRRGRR